MSDDLKKRAFARTKEGKTPKFAPDGLPVVEGTDESEDWMAIYRRRLEGKEPKPA